MASSASEPPISTIRSGSKSFAARARRSCRRADLVLAYHDRSDGGLFATLVEMAFAGHCGLDVVAAGRARLGAGAAVLRRAGRRASGARRATKRTSARCSPGTASVRTRCASARLARDATQPARAHRGRRRAHRRILDGPAPCLVGNLLAACASCATTRLRGRGVRRRCGSERPGPQRRAHLRSAAKTSPRRTSHRRAARGGRSCASRASTARWRRPRVRARRLRIPRRAHDRPALGPATLAEFKGLVACGGFSYGDVLGAGEGWAKSILFHGAVRDEFRRSSSATTRSRSASATAARCSPR